MDGYSISKNTSPILLSNYTTKICHDLRQIVSYYIKLVTTSWTYSIYCVQTMWSIAISKKCALPRNTKHKGIFFMSRLAFLLLYTDSAFFTRSLFLLLYPHTSMQDFSCQISWIMSGSSIFKTVRVYLLRKGSRIVCTFLCDFLTNNIPIEYN